MKIKKLLLVAVLSLSSVYTFGQGIAIQNGFVLGRDFMAESERSRSLYVLGLVDSTLASPLLDASQRKIAKFHECIKPMNSTQLLAITDLYLKNRPEIWDQSMNSIFYGAMLETCRMRGVDFNPRPK